MPFDHLPGRIAAIPTISPVVHPALMKPSRGPAIASGIEGLAKILERFTPEAKKKERMEDLKLAVEEKKAGDYLSGKLTPQEQAELNYKRALTQHALDTGHAALNKGSTHPFEGVYFMNGKIDKGAIDRHPVQGPVMPHVLPPQPEGSLGAPPPTLDPSQFPQVGLNQVSIPGDETSAIEGMLT